LTGVKVIKTQNILLVIAVTVHWKENQTNPLCLV